MVRHSRGVVLFEVTDIVVDTQPVGHLFLQPPVPSIQTSAKTSVAAAQFSKYKSALRQQLAGRTPLLNSTLSALERRASDIEKDLTVMLKSGDSGRCVAGVRVGCIG